MTYAPAFDIGGTHIGCGLAEDRRLVAQDAGRPHEEALGTECATMKAFVRTEACP